MSSLLVLAPTALAHPEQTGDSDHDEAVELSERDPADALESHDEVADAIVSGGPTGKKVKNLAVVGEGERLLPEATTDVWVNGRFAYLGTFNAPCGTGENYVEGVGDVDLVAEVSAPGVPIFDVRNKNRPSYVGNLPSVEGSRVNDVKVADLNSGTILVHSNEPCAGGPGGFEIYDVSDPRNPVHLASVRTGDVNETVLGLFGTEDVGVHNLFLFSQGDRDFVGAVVGSVFDNFQIFEITDPENPELVGSWGAEQLGLPGVQDTDDVAAIGDAVFNEEYGLNTGFGASGNRFLHDITISADGTRAYLSNWDAGLVLLDISDVSNPEVVSAAIDVEGGSLDGEVNSHAAWPSEDGRIVVETEEDFSAWEMMAPPGSLTFGDEEADDAPLPGTAVSTAAGDDFAANQTGNVGTVTGDQVVVTEGSLAGNTYAAIELSGDQPAFPEGGVTGELVYVGRLCDGDPVLNAEEVDEGDIAVVRRGACTFREKNVNADELGADAIVIANNATESTPWGGVRIWDYSDPENPVLASTFYTECSAASEPVEGCDPAGTYTVHNVIVESQGNRTLAYISWYSDGMVVLDVTDPYNPVEIARYDDDSAAAIADNGGVPTDYWGVYKVPNQPFIYGSDRNGGLDVFKLLGKGTAKGSAKGSGKG